ncbi:hypothetical protein OLL86_04275 [Gallibacterium anatis]|uniref:Uncharacterized protein n=1 Tax=Gallibacterium anatis TaxID=750 RepID=A0A0E3CC59_9PAST|nr:hypothetical protein [Gallibacterium anatis]KGQ40082.1 hypothetical protein JP30_08655 [Gallibacterium anatis IPDH697-78]KGQ50094.1 hypothetical protein IO46_09860 [Gallibacterium anatis]OBW97182.1 hypothetical protein QV02_01680 [Gallibacterium anatis]OBW99294.1 hypothetical protein QV03_03705 [Gallibacterium anatis]UZD16756.1 hypothetical protein OLL86_04275 [Gallibacterium anatis]
MIRQKSSKKVVARNKKRVSYFELIKRVEAVERAVLQQHRMNNYLTSRNDIFNLANENLQQRVTDLERQPRTFLQWLFAKLGR